MYRYFISTDIPNIVNTKFNLLWPQRIMTAVILLEDKVTFSKIIIYNTYGSPSKLVVLIHCNKSQQSLFSKSEYLLDS